MLEEAALEGAALADAKMHHAHGQSVRLCLQAFEARCARVRWELERIAGERAKRTACGRELPHQPPPPHKLVWIRLPPKAAREQANQGLAAARARAKLNLGWLPAPPTPCSSFADLDLWLTHPRLSETDGRSEAARVLALSSVERVFFWHASQLGKSVAAVLAAFHAEAEALEAVLIWYRRLVSKLARTSAGKAQFRTGLRSRETLLLWIGFCLVHEAAVQCTPELRSYAPALDWRDLRLLVLEDKSAVDAALHVASYLQANQPPAFWPVFSLRPGDKTFDFAREYARRVHGNIWRAEQAAAERRAEAHYAEVLRKQERLRTLDEELRVLETRHSQASDEYYRTRYPYDQPAEQAKDALAAEISSIMAEIRSEEKPPEPMYQPLPRDKDKADAILFFLLIKPAFRVLLRLSFSAAQAMLPRANVVQLMDSSQLDVASSIKRDKYRTNWTKYYTKYNQQYPVSCQPDVVVGSARTVPQAWEFSPDNVRHFSRRDDGVFYPDSLVPALFWYGRGVELDQRSCGYFNPFASVLAMRATRPRNDRSTPSPTRSSFSPCWPTTTLDSRGTKWERRSARSSAWAHWLNRPSTVSGSTRPRRRCLPRRGGRWTT
jgi:hypothetical protein